MISIEEIKKLAELARIDIEDKEIESLRGEMDAILGYIGQVKEITSNEEKKENPPLKIRGGQGGDMKNIMREDENPTESGTYSQELIAEFPEKEGDYLKVKKIL